MNINSKLVGGTFACHILDTDLEHSLGIFVNECPTGIDDMMSSCNLHVKVPFLRFRTYVHTGFDSESVS